MITRLLYLLLCIGALSSASANSYAIVPIEPPKASDITAFTNGRPPATGTQRLVKLEEIKRFLHKGERGTKLTDEEMLRRHSGGVYPATNGLFVTKAGQFYYWTLIGDSTLLLETPECGQAILRLPSAPEAAPSPEK